MKSTIIDSHRFYVALSNTGDWYNIMRETRRIYGNNWRTQPKIRRKLSIRALSPIAPIVWAWFDVPDPVWATWVATKFAVEVRADAPKYGK